MTTHKNAPVAHPRPSAIRRLFRTLGPGLVTGAADDDPSGIATYSQVGAQFGYGLAWTMLFGYPLLASIQSVCAEIGSVTGKGIAQNLRQHYPRWLMQTVVILLLIANVINLGADLGAMGAATLYQLAKRGVRAIGFDRFTPAEWTERHTSVSEADFAANPLRNRLAVLLSRTGHVAYPLGQCVLAPKAKA